MATNAPAIIQASEDLTALGKVPAADLAFLAKYGPPLQDAKVVAQLTTSPKEAPVVQQALKDSPTQWQRWWWICLAGQILFIPFIWLLTGRWSPRKAREDAQAHEEAVNQELAALTGEQPAARRPRNSPNTAAARRRAPGCRRFRWRADRRPGADRVHVRDPVPGVAGPSPPPRRGSPRRGTDRGRRAGSRSTARLLCRSRNRGRADSRGRARRDQRRVAGDPQAPSTCTNCWPGNGADADRDCGDLI